MSHLKDDSPRRQPPASADAQQVECPGCGYSGLQRSQNCPLCGVRCRVTESHITKKAFGAEDTDMRKGL